MLAIRNAWQAYHDLQRANWEGRSLTLTARITTLEGERESLQFLLVQEREDRAALDIQLIEAEARARDADERYHALRLLHTGHIRVASWLIDPVRLTSRLRAIHPTLRAERDGERLVVYADAPLTQPQLNALDSILDEPSNKT
jgi:hypothetical protein